MCDRFFETYLALILTTLSINGFGLDVTTLLFISKVWFSVDGLWDSDLTSLKYTFSVSWNSGNKPHFVYVQKKISHIKTSKSYIN